MNLIATGGWTDAPHETPADDVSDCLHPLLDALGWRGDRQALAQAMPRSGAPARVSELRDVLANLGYASRILHGVHLDRIDPRILPALVVEGDLVYVLTSPAVDGLAQIRRAGGRGVPTRRRLAGRRGKLVIFRHAPLTERRAGLEDGRWIEHLASRFRGAYGLILLLTGAIYLLALVPSLFIMSVYDRVVPAKSTATLLALLLGALGALAVEFLLRLARAQLLNLIGNRLGLLVGGGVFESFLTLPLAIGERMRLGVKMQRLQQTNTIRETFAGNAASTLIEIPFTLIFFSALAWIGGTLALVPVAAGLIYGLLAWALAYRLNRSAADAARLSMARSDLVSEAVAMMPLIRRVGGTGDFERRHREISGNAAFAGYVASRDAALVQNLSQAILGLAGMAAIMVGAQQVMAGRLTTGGLIAVMALTWRSLLPLQAAFLLLTRIGQMRGAIRSLNEAVRAPAEDDPALLDRDLDLVPRGGIELNRVVFRHSEDSDPALLGVSLRVEPGQILAITGPNGSGKSTLLKTIIGLYAPQGGAVVIDGNDIRHQSPVALRRSIGFAKQNFALLTGSIRDNIQLADPLATPAEIAAAAERAGLNTLLAELPGGIDHRVIADDDLVSPALIFGTSLAAAYLRQSRILILDETIDRLTPTMQACFHAELDRLRGHTTVLIVTHEPATMRVADRIAVITDGQITRVGRPDELLAPRRA